MINSIKRLITADEYRHVWLFFDDNSSINDVLKLVSKTKDQCSICKSILDKLNRIDPNELRIY